MCDEKIISSVHEIQKWNMKADCWLSLNGQISLKWKDIFKFLVAILFHFYVSSESVRLILHMRTNGTNSGTTKRSFHQFMKFKSEIWKQIADSLLMAELVGKDRIFKSYLLRFYSTSTWAVNLSDYYCICAPMKLNHVLQKDHFASLGDSKVKYESNWHTVT